MAVCCLTRSCLCSRWLWSAFPRPASAPASSAHPVTRATSGTSPAALARPVTTVRACRNQIHRHRAGEYAGLFDHLYRAFHTEGYWSNIDNLVPMKKVGENKWQAEVPLAPGCKKGR